MVDELRKRLAPEPVQIAVADAGLIEAALSAIEHRAVSADFKEDDFEDQSSVQIDDGGDSLIAQMVNKTIEMAVSYRASDIHIEPQESMLKIRVRVDGVLREIMKLPKSAEPALISRIKILSNLKIDEHRIPQDGQFHLYGFDQHGYQSSLWRFEKWRGS